ncbi:TPA: ABC transporter permease [Streptococcus agalactiae]
MLLIKAEIKKWKRSRILIGILILTVILNLFAIERAFSISRESPIMDSFGDLYCLAFKNITFVFLPITIGMISTMLFFDERKNDTLKNVLITSVSRFEVFFAKFILVELLTIFLMILTYMSSVLGAVLSVGFVDFSLITLKEAAILYVVAALLIPIAMLPVIYIATFSKSYVLPISMCLLYLGIGIFGASILVHIHPLASLLGVYQNVSSAAKEMVENSIGGYSLKASSFSCLVSILSIGIVFFILSIKSMKRQNY